MSPPHPPHSSLCPWLRAQLFGEGFLGSLGSLKLRAAQHGGDPRVVGGDAPYKTGLPRGLPTPEAQRDP